MQLREDRERAKTHTKRNEEELRRKDEKNT